MKTIGYTLFIVGFLFINNLKASDTLFFEDFNSWDFIEIEDSIFKDYDEDAIPDANGLPGGWFVANFANDGTDTSEIVALSSSWLENFMPGNRNWLMLPPINLGEGDATLSWRSAPALGNLYLDGYTVLISDNQYFYYDISLADTLMHFAQNINEDETQFSDGIVHSNLDFNSPLSLSLVTQYPGLLSNWSADISEYTGQEVYIGFLHNSDDDNFIALDDILVTGTLGEEDTTTNNPGNGGPVLSVEDAVNQNDLYVYPTIADDKITVVSKQNKMDFIKVSITNVNGKLVCSNMIIDADVRNVDVSMLQSGVYFVKLESKATSLIRKMVKR